MDSLITKLAAIRNMSEVIRKDKAGYGYKYTDITAILAKVTAGMKKYKVSLIPSIVPGTERITPLTIEKTKTDRTGAQRLDKHMEMLVNAEMIFRWVNDEDPEDYIEVPWILVGSQEDPSQAFGASLTYCTRYFLTTYFQIAQPEEDVDSYRSRQKEAEAIESKEIAAELVRDFDTMVVGYLAGNPERSEEVKEFIGRYVKGSDYRKITKPEIIKKLTDDFREKYLKEEK